MGNFEHPVTGSYEAAVASKSFPASPLAIRRFVDWATDNSPIANETFTVPLTAPYQVQIPVPLPQASLTIKVDDSPREIVRGSFPAAGQVGLDHVTGVLTFYSGDAGGACVYSVTPLVTSVMSEFLHWLQAEIRAAQSALLNMPMLLGARDDIDLKNAATTTILSAHPTAARVIESVLIPVTSASGLTAGPNIQIQDSDGNAIFYETECWNLTEENQLWRFAAANGPSRVLAATKSLDLRVVSAASGTSGRASALVFGYSIETF